MIDLYDAGKDTKKLRMCSKEWRNVNSAIEFLRKSGRAHHVRGADYIVHLIGRIYFYRDTLDDSRIANNIMRKDIGWLEKQLAQKKSEITTLKRLLTKHGVWEKVQSKKNVNP